MDTPERKQKFEELMTKSKRSGSQQSPSSNSRKNTKYVVPRDQVRNLVQTQEDQDFFEKNMVAERVMQMKTKKRSNAELEHQEYKNFLQKNGGFTPKNIMKWDQLQYGPAAQVLDWLLLGGEFDLEPDLVHKNKIRFVLNVADEVDSNLKKCCQDCSYLKVFVEDIHETFGDETWEIAFEFLDEAKEICKETGESCFVHCARGRSRSATIVIAYLMNRMKYSLLEAYKLVKEKRPRVGPHWQLKKQLIRYEMALFGKVSLTYDEWNLLELEYFEKFGVSY